ncbi:MAG: mandelate racemase [Chloroflexi bacterium]|nr:mandelate racemase [Chloroflexota bacterium]|tara:strand:- start:1609 stop:2781 length:1173 start_codon:yes stop_codon:yes gene_type:complete
MKITKVTPWLVSAPAPYLDTANDSHIRNREYVYIEVNTDEGITGWGEITGTSPVANRSVCAAIRHVSDHIKGDDPRLIEMIWNKIFRSFTYMGSRGATTNIISGIDIALWDIRGKTLGLPVYELFGGPLREGIPIYCHPEDGSSVKDLTQHAKAIVDTGQTSIKTDPWFPHHEEEKNGYLTGKLSAEAENLGAERIAAVRETVGSDIEILIDCHGRFDAPTAIRLAKTLEPYNIFWFEEPVPVESTHALKQVRDNVNVPICVGERIHTRWELIPILEQELADFVMPDVTWCGGISEIKKMATMSEAYYVPISPHDASGPINVLAGAHAMASVPNHYRVETSRAKLNAYDVMIDYPLDVRGDKIYLSKRPGLGIELDRDYMRANCLDGYRD